MMINEKHNGQTSALWAYGYELAPPMARDRMGGVQAVLDAGHSEAELAGRIWGGRFVNGKYITHILVVCGTPSRDLDVNHRLEAELMRLGAGYSVTPPLEVGRGRRRRSSQDRPSGPVS
jgi:hypothetical protein